MLSSFRCPSCGAQEWYAYKTYSYHAVKPSDKDLSVNCTNYADTRRQVLFNIWFPNEESVKLTSQYCKVCGFMCYSPRPTENDLQAKYQFLGQKEKIGALHRVTERALKLDKRRENFMFSLLRKYQAKGAQKVLDLGGGDGRLMRPFLQNKYDCYVVDYNENPFPGMKRLGSTFDDIPDGMRFDFIICSHVLEHVSDPGYFLRRLRLLLSDGGVVYIEVPFEVWKGIAITNDPVTHVNFFTVNSLKSALLLNGFKPHAYQKRLSSYGEAYKRVIWAVASVADIKKEKVSLDSRYTKSLLFPNFMHKLSRGIESFWLKHVLNHY